MKKIHIWLFLTSLCCSLSLYSSLKTLTEAKFSYFYPTSSTLREIYGTGGINYQFAFSYYVFRGLAVKTSVDYFSKDGESLNGKVPTHITITPVSLGAMYEYRRGMFGVYGGLGMRYFFVKITNDSPAVSPTSRGNGMGGYAEMGALFWVDPSITFDVFANYSYRKQSLSSSNEPDNVIQSPIQLGGLNVGVGVGFRF